MLEINITRRRGTVKKRKRAPGKGRTRVLLRRNLSLYFARNYLGFSYGALAREYDMKLARVKQVVRRETEYIEGEPEFIEERVDQ